MEKCEDEKNILKESKIEDKSGYSPGDSEKELLDLVVEILIQKTGEDD